MDFVQEIVYWYEPIKSGIIAAVGLTFLLSQSCMSLISFNAYTGISLMCCTTACKLYNFITCPFKSNHNLLKNPFKYWLESDITLPQEQTLNYLGCVVWLQDYLETAKFVVCLYLLSVVGAWFNLLTLITIAFVLGMTCPKIYLLCKPLFDAAFQITKEKVINKLKFAEAKVPGLRKKSSTQ
ncbi:unnamed protein product [Trichobilharzia regenti]|nr:unnamed protein product [Trichobilharzia regenti]